MVVEATGFRYPANVSPLVLGGAALVLLTIVLIRDGRAYRRGTAAVLTTDAEAAQIEEAVLAQGATPQQAAEETAEKIRRIDAAEAERMAAAYSHQVLDPQEARHERQALGWVLISIVLLLLLGFLIGVTIAMVGMLRFYARERWVPTIVTTTAVMVTLYVAFGMVLGVDFFPGFVPEWLDLSL